MTDKYKIVLLADYNDCETCGYSYDSGYVIYKNDEVLVDKTPNAHCYDGTNYEDDNPYKDILEHLKVNIEEVPYRESEEESEE